MTGRYRVTAPEPKFTGDVGTMHFKDGVYEGDVADAALHYFEGAGYDVVDLDDDPDGPGGLPPKSSTRADLEQAGRDLGLTDDEVTAPANKDDLYALLEQTEKDRAAAAADNENGASE